MNIMGILLLGSWILGLLLSILFAIGAWINKDKEQWESSGIFFLLAFTTGYLTTIPIICVVGVLSLNDRFK
jgi:membrane protein CcdC involved in cytochrome C biogenesis